MRTCLSTAILLLAMCCTPHAMRAQVQGFSGSVVDAATGEALADVNIVVMQRSGQRARTGGMSDAAGRYSIAVPFEGTITVRFSHVGYRAQTRDFTFDASVATRYDIRLEADVVGLDEVVVTGVASRAEKNRAEVAVSRLDASELLEGNAYQDVSQLLAAKVPGLRVSPSSGTVGGGINFSMRSGGGLFGSGQPLLYLDGVRIANDEIGDFTGGQFVSTLADLNPEDIENIEVLKGPASAALYGTSGSNGVIRITTKRGRRGAGGSDIGYKIASGWNEQATKYTRDMALTADAANALFRSGPVTEQSVHFSGRAPNYDYYASYANRSETGILPNNTLGRNSFRLNAAVLPSELLRVNVSANALFSDTRRPLNDNSIIGMLGNTLIFGPAEAGGQGTYFFADSAAVQGVVSDTRTRRFIGSVEAELTPLPTLSLRGLVGYDGSSWRSEQTYPSNLDYSRIGVLQGWRAVSDNTLDLVNVDLYARWLWSPSARLTASSTVGAQAFLRTLRGTSLTKSEFPSDLITSIGAGSRFEQGGEQFADSREAGVFFQQDVAVDDRIFLSAGVRNDYASAIGADAPSVWYPRAGVALRLDRFGFLPPLFTLAKLRAAYGEAGILPGPLDGSGLRWGAVPTGSGTGAALVFIGNSEIEPERVKELEIGMEVEFSAAAGFDVTWYRQYARNSIISFLNPPSTGLTATATPRNVGAIDGEGVEAASTRASSAARSRSSTRASSGTIQLIP
ncbi:MAG: TonB-dependent receptor [Ignavibacteria bacterium]|nr:TonB-dependent receptor [Ignavibacteria bacterium]